MNLVAVLVAVMVAMSLSIAALNNFAVEKRATRRRSLLKAFSPVELDEVPTPPWHDALGLRVGRLLLLPMEETRIDRLLAACGLSGQENLDRIVRRKGLLVCLVGGLAVLVGIAGWFPWVVALLAVAAANFYPVLDLQNKQHYRNLEIARSLPKAVDMLVLAVESGMNFINAVSLYVELEKGPVVEELMRLLRQIELGESRTDALASLQFRITEESLQAFAKALIQAETLGVSVVPVLKEQASMLRKSRSSQARERAQKLPVKILFPVMLCFVPSIFLIVIGPIALAFL